MHQIWVIVDGNDKIKHCWESQDPPSKELINKPPIVLNPMPSGWKIIKIKAPGLLKQFQEEAQNEGKSLSQFILKECEIDQASHPGRPEGLPAQIDYREIRRKT